MASDDIGVIVHGWVLTDPEHRLLRQIQVSPGEKSAAIMQSASKLLSNHHGSPVDLLRIEGGEVIYVAEEVREHLPESVRELAAEKEGLTALAQRQAGG